MRGRHCLPGPSLSTFSHSPLLYTSPLSLPTCSVEVKDVSGGCGDFYQVLVVSPRFAGLNTVKQHRAVNAVLEADIGKMHGLTLKTMDPAQWAQARAAAGDKA